MAPIMENLLLLLQPASRMPRIPNDEAAMMKKMPILKSSTWSPRANGRQLKVIMELITTRNGARL